MILAAVFVAGAMVGIGFFLLATFKYLPLTLGMLGGISTFLVSKYGNDPNADYRLIMGLLAALGNQVRSNHTLSYRQRLAIQSMLLEEFSDDALGDHPSV